MKSVVSYERTGSVVKITINRESHRNAIDRQTGTALREAFARLDEDDDAAVGVVIGSGETFCAGADLDEFVKGATLENREHGFMGFSHIQTQKPLIAAIEGYAIGGGLELALFCDLRIAAKNATFGCFERRVGAPLIDGATQRLPRMIGIGRALDVILTGREISVEEAYEWGLVNRIVDTGEALSTAVSIGETLASYPQKAIHTDRKSVYMGLGEPLDRGLAIESWWGIHAMTEARTEVRTMVEANEGVE